ncbi:MAG: zinc-binding dehydrogenase [Candidatus Krumholzibacteria bacterium]|nr:zinc-binding dehydrogenase [Candidatus Krumholzibacteria bacterium]
MRAVYYEEHGGPDVLKIGDFDDPAAARGQVVIDVKSVSLNHIDLFLRRGLPGLRIPLPHIPGCDAAGVVSEVGEDVTTVAVGDRVLMNPSVSCGQCEFCVRGDASLCTTYTLIGETTQGTCCEKIVVPAINAIPIPDSLSFDDAASIPLVFLTAWRMMIKKGRLRAGESILILGASAGVGIAAIQIAKVAGARVLAAASTDEKLELCRALGADVLINYAKEDFVKRVRTATGKRGVDVVIDYVGKETWVKSLKSLASGGRLLTCGATTGYDPQTDLRHIFYRQLEVIGSTMGSRNDLMAPLNLILEGRMRTVVGAVFDLEETAEAHRVMEERRALGKIVLKVS